MGTETRVRLQWLHFICSAEYWDHDDDKADDYLHGKFIVIYFCMQIIKGRDFTYSRENYLLDIWIWEVQGIFERKFKGRLFFNGVN